MEEMKLELERRKKALAMLKRPVITARMRFGGLRTRTQRQEIVRHRREIERQRKSYEKDIKKVKEYLKVKEEFEKLEPIENGHMGPIAPKISLFASPRLRRMRRKTKFSSLGRY